MTKPGDRAPDSDPTDPAPEREAALPAGARLGKYQIVRRLGAGGMGSVYEAVHTEISKPVALKTLSARLSSEPRAQTRFLREAAASSRLDHPHVVDVTDFGADGGITFLVMELLRGEDLGGLLARERAGLPVERVVDVMLAVCAGVFAAHEAGVIHRDLKPQNIFLARTPLGDVVAKVLDFGISKLLDEEMAQTLTRTGTVLGTTPYLSPEQVAGHAVDVRSDQYTVGVILYECATGRRPHVGDGMFAIMKSITEGRFQPPRAFRRDLPPAFEAVVLRAMALSPGERFESVHALGRALLPFASTKRRLLWADYFGSAAPSSDPAPTATEILPRPTPDSLPRTRTQRSPAPTAPRRAHLMLAAAALAAASATAILLRRPPPLAPPSTTSPVPPVEAPAPQAPAPSVAAPARPPSVPRPTPTVLPRKDSARRTPRRPPKVEHGPSGVPILE